MKKIEQCAQEIVYAASIAQKDSSSQDTKDTMIRIIHDRFDELETLILEI